MLANRCNLLMPSLRLAVALWQNALGLTHTFVAYANIPITVVIVVV